MIVIQYGGYFCGPKIRSVRVPIYHSFVAICYQLIDRRKYLPRDRLGLRDFSRIQEGVCSTTKRSPNIEGDDEFPRRARVKGAACIHDGSQRKATDEV